MIPIDGQPILTVTQMRAAEERAIAAGSSVEALMERAGVGVAEAVRRFAAGAPVLVLCGPGNNGGDGYVAARVLKANGVPVRVAAIGDPKSEAAIAARRRWDGPVERIEAAASAPIVVDALFGTGLSRPLDGDLQATLAQLVGEARLSLAVDLPSGVATDDGALLGEVPRFDLTFALGAVKPAHVLMPAAPYCGNVRVIDIGLSAQDLFGGVEDPVRVIERPSFFLPDQDSQKYSRGMVIVIAGKMPGAASLAAAAAAHAGAGYVILLGDSGPDAGLPNALVRREWSPEALHEVLEGKRNAVIVIGPGLGRDDDARAKLAAAIATGQRLVIDGDALHLLDDSAFAKFAKRDVADGVILTPHAGEFAAAFGEWSGSKIDAARDAAGRSGATVVFKGPDTVIASRDDATTVASLGNKWLSAAGTGDALAGAIAAAVCSIPVGDPGAAGVWVHAEAARRLGGAFIADDLVRELSVVRGSL